MIAFYRAMVIGQILIGLLLIGLAVPRLISAVLVLPVRPVFEDIRLGRDVELERLVQAQSLTLSASAWVSDGRILTDRALALGLHADRLAAGSEMRASFERLAAASLAEGLAKSPGNPYAWFRMAAISQRLNKAPRLVVSLLLASVMTGEVLPRVMIPRLTLAFANWEHMDEREKDVIRNQMRIAWHFDTTRLYVLARRMGMLPILQDALQPLPGASEHLKKLMH